MLGTVLLFVLLTPGVVGTLSLGFKQKLAPVIIHAVIFALLLANYRSIPVLNMLEPFQTRNITPARRITAIAPVENRVDSTAETGITNVGGSPTPQKRIPNP